MRTYLQSEFARRKVAEDELLERVKGLEERVSDMEDDTPPARDASVQWNFDEQCWDGPVRVKTKKRDKRQNMIFFGDMVTMKEMATGRWAGRSVGKVIGVTVGGNVNIECDGIEGHTRRGCKTVELI